MFVNVVLFAPPLFVPIQLGLALDA